MLKIIADHKIPFLRGAFENVARIEYLPGPQIRTHHLKDAHALITRTRTPCNEELLHGTPVRFIATATIGFDHIDTEYCRHRGIRWVNAPGCNANSVKQYLGSSLAYIHNRQNKKIGDLTLGIIGAGHVGSRVQVMAGILGIPCLVNDPPRERTEKIAGFLPLDEVLERSDIISMHVPLESLGAFKTFHMADDSFFSKMKKGAWFINTARGEVHNTPALLGALNSGHLSGAIIDVWENEPSISRELLQAGSITTPHIAGYSLDGKANGTIMCVQSLSRFFNLGLDNWRPEIIPPPASPNINLSCNSRSKEEVFHQLAFTIYDIMKDSEDLRSDPESFETLRENYPIRRESKAYTVSSNDCSPEMMEMIKKLGFQTRGG